MSSLPLGTNKQNNLRAVISEEQRSTHMHIIGSSGEGKSKFMEYMIRQDIIEDRGLCLIDPHGDLYNDIVSWMTQKGMLNRAAPKKVILFDPSNDDWTFGFNPLSYSGINISYHVDAMVNATAKVWGGEDTNKTPLLKRVLKILFHALAENNLTLLEAGMLLNPNDSSMRKYITENVKDWIIKQQWEYFSELKPKPFYDECGSAINRIMEFLASQEIRNIIGQLENTIDFRKIMDESSILLVNLSTANRISDDNARLLGTLIVNDLFLKARTRPKEGRPFYLYIDECSLFINEDIKRILDEGRKFKLHLILAHQHLAQLRKVGEDVYSAVMTDAKTKVIFGGLSADDAKTLVEQVFLGEVDYQEAKEKFDRTAVIGYTTKWCRNFSKGKSLTSGNSKGTGIAKMESLGFTTNENIISENITEGSSWNSFDSDSYSETDTSSEGMSETLVPILGKESGAGYSLEEQINKQMALMVNQPQRQAILKLPKKHTIILETPYVNEAKATEEEVFEFREKCFKLNDFCKLKSLVEASIDERHKNLIILASKNESPLKKEDFLERENL